MTKITTFIISFFMVTSLYSQDVKLNIPPPTDTIPFFLKNKEPLTIICCTGFITSSLFMKKNPNMMYLTGGFLLCSVTLQIPEIKKNHAKLHRRKK